MAYALSDLESLDEQILESHRILKSLPRSNCIRTDFLLQVATLQAHRGTLSGQISDLDKAIAHLTEAILPSPIWSRNVVFAFFKLGVFLLSRFLSSHQIGDDLKSSVEYLNFIRINFYPPEAFVSCFDIPLTSGDLSTQLSLALGLNLLFNPGHVTQPAVVLEDIVALIPEFITADMLTERQKLAILTFSSAVTTMAPEMYRQEGTQRVFNRAIQVLREVAVLNPDLDIAYALAMCLAIRFETTFVMTDCEEAITNFDKVIATCSPRDNLTAAEEVAMLHILSLLVSRVNFSPSPENLEDAIHRLRTFLPYSLKDEDRAQLTNILDAFTHKRFKYFGITGNQGGTPLAFDPSLDIQSKTFFVLQQRGETGPQLQDQVFRLGHFVTAIMNSETTDVEAIVEGSRRLIPLQKYDDQWQLSSELAYVFAGILWHAYLRTNRLDYLNEAIATSQDLHKISTAPKLSHFHVGTRLHDSLRARLKLLRRRQDFEELMQLCPELVYDSSGEIFTRFEISCFWAGAARVRRLPSASMAYETAMSLLQETLVFCPTLQTQHLRLAQAFEEGGSFTSNYASYRIENGQVKQAIETLEQGRTLIWSEMRGLRTSADQLRAADPAIAENFSEINQKLESVAMSVADGDLGHSEAGTERSIGHLVLTQRALLEKRNALISHIQSLPGFEHFLKSPSFDFLNAAASHGPVIIVNQSQSPFPSHIILLLKDSPPSIISTPSSFYDRANRLKSELLRVRKKKPEGPGSEEYGHTLANVLTELYELVGKSVVEELRRLEVPEKSRVWWCPTDVFCSLPLHAMGPIPSDDGKKLYFSDLYIPSYTPSLCALIESRKRGSSSDASDNSKPSILLVAQPETLPGAFGEVEAIEATKTTVTTLISAMATPETVIEGLRNHRFAHFVCHGKLETGKPFDSSLELHEADLTLLAIVRSQLPAAEFAFLAACHTAELTEGSVADEGLHLAAAMQYCGFRSVVGTMWAMADTDGADLSKHFYKTLFPDKLKASENGVPCHERSARALQNAVKKLRKKRGITLERWVNFVHYGA